MKQGGRRYGAARFRLPIGRALRLAFRNKLVRLKQMARMFERLTDWLKTVFRRSSDDVLWDHDTYSRELGPLDQALDNFIFKSQPDRHERGTIRWAAALAKNYSNLANSGGINSFLTNSYEIATEDVREALLLIGSNDALRQFDTVINGLGGHLPLQSQDERWDTLEKRWTEELNAHDFLDDAELETILDAHVAADQEFYRSL